MHIWVFPIGKIHPEPTSDSHGSQRVTRSPHRIAEYLSDPDRDTLIGVSISPHHSSATYHTGGSRAQYTYLLYSISR